MIFIDNNKYDAQWNTNWCDRKHKIFRVAAFFDIFGAIIGTHFSMNGQYLYEGANAIQSTKFVGFDLRKDLG